LRLRYKLASFTGVAVIVAGVGVLSMQQGDQPESAHTVAPSTRATTRKPSAPTTKPASTTTEEKTATPTPSPQLIVWSCARLGLQPIASQSYDYMTFGGAEGYKYPGGEVCEGEGKSLPSKMDDCLSLGSLVRWPECSPPIWICSNEFGTEGYRPCYPYIRYKDDRPLMGG
jgi:hypothetical protein